ncbi:hypothetical protein HNW77_09315 [Komagataeibacter sp. AV436]|uniref:LysM domain-containing protein n=1 Tax=Komagataeibacter melomenusus TaxID=2766578 RepID=A0ABX2AE31_9PROT|nr:hypothetical protein [Komagataeibacter melomenusus]MBV1830585.1 hypothetical protein [Komagataeibacter melomenusus]NPC66588.1 hypothetical protein [Komagataeibacter melomenusus]
MPKKLIIFFSLLIMSFDIFVLIKAAHPTASENYIDHFIKKTVSTDQYNYNELRAANHETDAWRFNPICQLKHGQCVLQQTP